MPDSAAALVSRFDTAIAEFRTLVERLSPAHWRLVGLNAPGPRLFPEDEDRPVGVIAYHVAAWLPRHTALMRARAHGEAPPPIDANALNAEEAVEHARATPGEVLDRLAAEVPHTRSFIAGLDDGQLARTWETRFGPMNLGSAVERVLIGHVEMHRASIEAAIEESERDV